MKAPDCKGRNLLKDYSLVSLFPSVEDAGVTGFLFFSRNRLGFEWFINLGLNILG